MSSSSTMSVAANRRRRRSFRDWLVAAVLTAVAVGATGCSSSAAVTSSQPGLIPPAAGQGGGIEATGMARSEPVRVQVPAISVDSPLIGLGLRDDGTLEVPPTGFPAGWYTGARTPGEIGPAIIAGHVDWAGLPGVFYDLRDLAPGDEITVAREDGSTTVFRVTDVEAFPKDDFPTDLVYGDIDYAGLRLITCGGSFDRQARSYVDNIVAFAELVGTDTG